MTQEGVPAAAASATTDVAAAPRGPWSRRDIAQIAVLLGVAAAMTALWTLTPLGKRCDPQVLANWAAPWRADPLALLYVVATHAVLGLVGFPITILQMAAILLFGAPLGMAYSWIGGLANATTGYLLGRLVTKPTLLERLDRTGAIRGVLARHGVISVAVLRNIPIGPFIVVNLIAGATRLRYRDYILGTAIGMIPPMVAVGIGTSRLLEALRHPNALSLGVLGLTIVCIVLGIAWLRHRLRSQVAPPPSDRA